MNFYEESLYFLFSERCHLLQLQYVHFSTIVNLYDPAVTCKSTYTYRKYDKYLEFLASVLCNTSLRTNADVVGCIQLSYAYWLLHRLSAVLNLLNVGFG